jgi:energy-coupling factor transport system substrate-specific component
VRRSLGYGLAVLVAASALALGFAAGQWVAAAIVLGVALALAIGVFVESGPGSAKEVALIAALTAIAVAGRLLVHPFPGVQPMTVIVIASGAAFGLRIGVSVGALGALVSNFFLIQGPWTPWQMALWALCGAIGALAAPLVRRRLAFALLCALAAYGFSTAMDVSDWWYRYAHTWAGLTLSLTTGFPFTLAHALGSFTIALAVGPELGRMLERYARRLKTDIVWAEPVGSPAPAASMHVEAAVDEEVLAGDVAVG